MNKVRDNNKAYSSEITRELLGESYNEVLELYNKISKDKEFELSLYGYGDKRISMERYQKLIKRVKLLSRENKYEISSEYSLDVIYNEGDKSSYRITVLGIDNVNNIISQFHKYNIHVIFNSLIEKCKNNERGIIGIKKVKESKNTIDILDYNIRFRLSDERKLTSEDLKLRLTHNEKNNIIFRLKERVSLYTYGNKDSKRLIRCDLTIAKMSKRLDNIQNAIKNYELEIEMNSDDKPDESLLNNMIYYCKEFLMVLQDNKYIIGNEEQKSVIKEYCRIDNLDISKVRYLNARQPVSLEIQHVTEKLIDKQSGYAVTDKSDGARYFMIILKGRVYLISTNLDVKFTGIELDRSLKKYDDTIMDGEYIYLPKIEDKRGRYIFLVFDCLYIGGKSVMNEMSLLKRLSYADEVISKCFILGKQKGYEYKEYKSKSSFDLEDVTKFHASQIDEFMSSLNKDIELEKDYPLVRRKYFVPSLGIYPWDIFKFSVMVYNRYTQTRERDNKNENKDCPYELDGLIYQPLQQQYETKVSLSKFSDYKWKPENKNSIDFYIRFSKNPSTGKVNVVYDNSNANYVEDKLYIVCNLHVGRLNEMGYEEPVLFREKEEGYEIRLQLNEKGMALDEENQLINDNTVVEFYYVNNPELDYKYRWVPMRTRYDKTESVLRNKTRYGNYQDTANKVWRSIINPVLMSDLDDLSKGNDEKNNVYYYDNKMSILRGRIQRELIVSTNKESAYFQLQTNIARNMRDFHNYVKQTLYTTYMGSEYRDDKKVSVLDIGIGRGSDLMRYYTSKISNLVGVEYNREAIYSAVDGLISRYNNYKRKYPNFPKMDFIRGDGRALFDYENQNRALGGMDIESKKLYEKYFPKDISKRATFDRIVTQFAIHYFLENEESWNNYKQNINNTLKPNGYFICTTFDGSEVVKAIGNNDRFTTYYTNEKGEKKVFFEIIKKYKNFKENEIIGLGNTIDMYSCWLQLEGNYEPEYLVDKRFIIEELERDCNLELIDTGMFSDIFLNDKEFITEYSKYQFDKETRNYLYNKIAPYYQNNEINKAGYENTKLQRFYVFKKKEKLILKGGGHDLMNNKEFTIGKLKLNSDVSFMRTIHNALQKHKIIPKSLNYKEFYNEINIPIYKDIQINPDIIEDISKRIAIYHIDENNNKETKIIDGLNIVVASKECDGFYEYNNYILNDDNNAKTIIINKNNNDTYDNIYKKEGRGYKALFNYDEISKIIE